MSNEIALSELARSAVDLIRGGISNLFEVQTIFNDTVRVWLARTHDGFAILEEAINLKGKVGESCSPASVAEFDGNDILADRLLKTMASSCGA